jgi:hypothetical protein
VVLLIGLLLTSAVGNSSETPLKWVTFDRLCGSLEFFTPIPGGGNDSRPLKNVRLELYHWEEGTSCCSKSRRLFKTVTRKAGRYEFKSVDAGRYWLVAHWKDKILQLPVQFTAKDASSEDCELQGLDIDSSGNFGAWLGTTM